MRTRRQFIRDSWKWSGLIFVPSLIRAQPAFPPAFWGPAPAASGGGCGNTLAEQNGTNGNGLLDEKLLWAASSQSYWGTYFIASATETICKIQLHIERVGSPTFTMKAAIWNWDSGSDLPTTQRGTASDAVTIAGISTSSYAYVDFPNVSASLTNGTQYVVVGFSTDGSGGDVSNSIKWDSQQIDGNATHTIWKSGDGATWSASDIAKIEQLTFKTYK